MRMRLLGYLVDWLVTGFEGRKREGQEERIDEVE